MSLKLYVKLQTPTIELPVKAKDPSGAKQTIYVGFRREEEDLTTGILKKFSSLTDKYLRQLLGQPLDGKATEENQQTEEYEPEEIKSTLTAISNIIAENIVYIRQGSFELEDLETGKITEFSVTDTRKAKAHEGLWEDADSCLSALIDLYLSSPPWRPSFTTAFQKALLNIDIEDGKIKN